MAELRKRVEDHTPPHLVRGFGDQWPEHGILGAEGPHGPVGASYMMASAPAGGQTYTAQNLGMK
jgi:hypothetical protein